MLMRALTKPSNKSFMYATNY